MGEMDKAILFGIWIYHEFPVVWQQSSNKEKVAQLTLLYPTSSIRTLYTTYFGIRTVRTFGNVLFTLRTFAYELLRTNICVRTFDIRTLCTTYFCIRTFAYEHLRTYFWHTNFIAYVYLRTNICIRTFVLRTLAIRTLVLKSQEDWLCCYISPIARLSA